MKNNGKKCMKLIIAFCMIVALDSLCIVSANAVCEPGQTCDSTWIGGQSGANSGTGQGHIVLPGSGVDRFPDVTNGEVSSFNVFTDADGNVLGYYLPPDYDPRDMQNLLDAGVPSDLIYTYDDFVEKGIPLPTGSIEDKDKAAAWEQFYDNLAENFAIINEETGQYEINPNSAGYLLGVALGIYSGDITKDTENLLSGNTNSFGVMTGAWVIIDGEKTLITSENAHDVCKKYIDDTSNTPAGEMGSYCRAIQDSIGEFGDEGDASCVSCPILMKKAYPDADNRTIAGYCCLLETGEPDTYGTICCKFFHTPDECKNYGDDDDDDDDEIPKVCKKPTYEPEIIEPREKNNPSTVSSGCGGTYTDIDYIYTEEDYIVYEEKVVTTITFPTLSKSIYYAGETFSWRDISSNQTTVKIVYDTAPLENQISILETEIKNCKANVEYSFCMSDACNNLPDEAKNECQKNVEKAKENAISSCESEEKKSKLESYKEKLANALVMKPIRTNISNIASIDKSYITFYGTDLKYDAGEVVAIEKNTGNPLTQKDLNEELLKLGAYLTVMSDFYVPTSITNGSSLTAHRKISFGNDSVSYECPANVTNYFICDDDDCEKGTKIIYRPISLTNPFPYTENEGDYAYRAFGGNWSQSLAETYVLNNRNVSDYDVYELEPLYTITLTPSDIKSIREYNKTHNYNDFNLTCTDGYNCLSSFLWNDFYKIIDNDNSCASSTGWDMNCYNGGVSE